MLSEPGLFSSFLLCVLYVLCVEIRKAQHRIRGDHRGAQRTLAFRCSSSRSDRDEDFPLVSHKTPPLTLRIRSGQARRATKNRRDRVLFHRVTSQKNLRAADERNFGYSAAHEVIPVPLLPSGPGGVRGTSSHRARSSTHRQSRFSKNSDREESLAQSTALEKRNQAGRK